MLDGKLRKGSALDIGLLCAPFLSEQETQQSVIVARPSASGARQFGSFVNVVCFLSPLRELPSRGA